MLIIRAQVLQTEARTILRKEEWNEAPEVVENP